MPNKNEKTMPDYNVRRCGFNPADKLIDIEDMATGKSSKYLLVQDRVLWFVVYCDENQIKGVIDDSQIEYIEALNMFKATCTITMDGEVISKSSGSCVYTPGEMEKAIETACTSAKGRALANAGFGTAMCYQDSPEPIPCDAGVKPNTAPTQDNPLIPKQGTNTNPLMPQNNNKGNAAKTNMPTTLAEAQSVVVNIKGDFYGKTLGEVFALDPNYLTFLRDKYNASKHPEYKKAAEIILMQ